MQQKSGYSLIEVLISVSVLSIAITTTTNLVGKNLLQVGKIEALHMVAYGIVDLHEQINLLHTTEIAAKKYVVNTWLQNFKQQAPACQIKLIEQAQGLTVLIKQQGIALTTEIIW